MDCVGIAMITVRRAVPDDADWMQSSFDTQMGWSKPDGYFAGCCHRQAQGACVLLVAAEGEQYAGHVIVEWASSYPHFRENGIPEISDLIVLPAYRQQGVATALVDEAEAIIRQRSPVAGIGVGLYADYGAAQRMYVLRGYIPDGYGVMYNDAAVTPGTTVPVDDALNLFLVKTL
jgi:ribosomal protein S18 acetylase RimI-like enzyme